MRYTSRIPRKEIPSECIRDVETNGHFISPEVREKLRFKFRCCICPKNEICKNIGCVLLVEGVKLSYRGWPTLVCRRHLTEYLLVLHYKSLIINFSNAYYANGTQTKLLNIYLQDQSGLLQVVYIMCNYIWDIISTKLKYFTRRQSRFIKYLKSSSDFKFYNMVSKNKEMTATHTSVTILISWIE